MSAFFAAVSRRVEARSTKILLAMLIIASLLPLGREVHRSLAPVLAVVFGAELAVRLIVLFAPAKRRSSVEIAFIAVDLLAFLSFLPIEDWLPVRGEGETLRTALTLLRLTRLLVLLRFARELARDLYAIMTRREQLMQFGLVTATVAALAFVSAVVLSQTAEVGVTHDFDGDGVSDAETFYDQLWWSFRQLESSDNLVGTVRVHPLVLLVSLLLTVTGVFVISFIIGIGTNVVDQVIQTERRRAVGYEKHALVIGEIHEHENLVREFVRIYDRNWRLRRLQLREIVDFLLGRAPMPRRHALARMALLGPHDEVPGFLYEPMMRWVVYRQGDGADPAALVRVGAHVAKRVILLARPDTGADADAITVSTLGAFRALNTTAHVYVEVLSSKNHDLVLEVGGAGTFPLDVPRFLGLFLCQHVVVSDVELLYRDLLNAEGAEFYTHVYTTRDELEPLFKSAGPTIAFNDLAAAALQHRVTLVGVLLGDGELATHRDARVNVEELTPWLNPLAPLDSAPAEAQVLGAEQGRVPVRTLRGLIAICETYEPLRRFARELGTCRATLSQQPPASDTIRSKIKHLRDRAIVPSPGPRRVLIIGYSPALESLVRELARFVPGIEIVLVVGSRGDEDTSIEQRLSSLGMGILPTDPLPGDRGRDLGLERGGRLTIFTHEGNDLSSFACQCLRSLGPTESVVFLSEPDAADRDARTAMRVMRFARALRDGAAPRGDSLHIVAEFAAMERGERVRRFTDAAACGFEHTESLRLTLLGTEQIKNYFMVHSAFVPGVTSIYDELLSERGQDIIRFDLTKTDDVTPVTIAELAAALAPRGFLPVAALLTDGSVVLNPGPTRAFAAAEVRAVFGVGDAAHVTVESSSAGT